MNNESDLQKSLEQEAQQIEERIPMTNKDTAKIADRLRRVMTERELTNTHIARALGVSNSVISQFLNHKYKGDTITLGNKIANYINSLARKERRRAGKPAFINTTVARQIATLITNTESSSEDEGKIGILIGDGGHGKSHCMRAYAKSNKNTIYVELDDAMTMKTVFGEIAAEVGLETYGTLDSVTRRLIDNLRHRHIIVMLDECSSLSVGMLNKLRQVIVVKSRCPLILAGNHGLLSTINLPTNSRGRESLDQFTSRMSSIVNLDKLKTGAGGDLYTLDDIRKLYEYGGIRLVGGAADSLKRICMSLRSGHLRTCSHLITALHTTSEVKKTKQITAQLIIDILVDLDLPVRVRLPLDTCRKEAADIETAVAATG
jgi:DNA transposition AAA+ family ATPase